VKDGGGTPGYIPTPGNCRFEDGGNPGIPNGYFIKPVSGSYSRGWGCFTHDAIDWAASQGTPVVASAAGTVVEKNYQSRGYGHYVVLRHNLANGNRVYTLYAHMNEAASVSGGQGVARGQQIGRVGTTGNSTGFHLHFMIISQSYESSGAGCRLGMSKCYNPARFVSL
jgi:murein DD-endopeptidase MepM/ murein hydrolase activator NlpD